MRKIAFKKDGPFYAGAAFFLLYHWWMAVVLYAGRQLPPTNDSFYYVFRIRRAMEGAWINDTSILYTYLIGGLGKLFGLDPFQAFHLGTFLGPVLITAVLWVLFRALKLSAWLSALAFVLLSFYCNIGPHTFLHFVPSTFAVMLSLLWLGLVADGKMQRPWLSGFVVCLLQIFAHSSGMYVVLVNGALLALIEGYRRNWKVAPVLACMAGAFVVGVAALRFFPFDALLRTVDQARWLQPEEVKNFLEVSGSAATDFGATTILTRETKLAPWDVWMGRLNSSFFIFLFPTKKLVPIIVPILLALVWNSLRRKTSAIRNPYLWVFFCSYFVLFIVLSYSHERGARFVEFAWPLALILLAVLLYDIEKRWLRAAAIAGSVAYLAFLSFNFVTTENLREKRLTKIEPGLLKELNEGIVFYTEARSASYLLANGVEQAQYLYFLPFFKRLNGPYYLGHLGNCPTPEPDFIVRKIFRAVSPRRDFEVERPVIGYAKTLKNIRYEPWIGDHDQCFYIQKIRF